MNKTILLSVVAISFSSSFSSIEEAQRSVESGDGVCAAGYRVVSKRSDGSEIQMECGTRLNLPGGASNCLQGTSGSLGILARLGGFLDSLR